MKSKGLLIILSVVFAVLTVAFAGMTVMNLTAAKGPAQEPVAMYTLVENCEPDAINKALGSIVSNAQKKTSYPAGMLNSMKAAYAINKNLAGRITIPGTELDTVFVKGKDNDYYLKRDFYDRYTNDMTGTNYGNVFLDYRCPVDGTLAKNMILHGHTTGKSDGIPKQSFRSLYDYRKKEHFIEHPIVRLTTLYGVNTYKICAVFYSTTQPAVDNHYFFNYIYPDMSDSNMTGYIEQVQQRMLYETGVSLENTDNILTLSTCIYDFGKHIDTRLVVVARLLHDGEDESIDASLVKDHPDYRRPQRWYDNNGKTNPYKNTEKWQPSPD